MSSLQPKTQKEKELLDTLEKYIPEQLDSNDEEEFSLEAFDKTTDILIKVLMNKRELATKV